MANNTLTANEMIGRVVLELTRLPEEDLPLVIEFVDYLSQQRQSVSTKKLSVTEIRTEARRLARRLNEVPRSEIVTRFQELAKEIHQGVVAKGVAIEGDWPGD